LRKKAQSKSRDKLSELIFVGLGLYDERDLSLRGLQAIKEADTIFVEQYTSLMPGFSASKLEKLCGKRITPVSRRDLEEEDGLKILNAARKGKTVLLVPGDPLIATTHVDLRIRAEKQGIKTRVIHGASIISAVIGLSGLQNYKYGRSVTIPFADEVSVIETPYNVIMENKKRGLHTLCFLDIKAEEKRYMTINQGLRTLMETEKTKRKRVITPETLAVGIARAGSETPTVKADYAETLVNYDFGSPPHSVVFPGRLHFVEAEALVTLAGAPKDVLELVK
jgi:diphthine synthase